MMKVEVVTPEEFMGDVIGDLNSRRGQVGSTEPIRNATAINAVVPLANMFGYINNLRSSTQGRAQYTMQFSHYDKVPQNVQDAIKIRLNYGKSKYKNHLKAYDNKILDLSTEEIVNTAKRTGVIKGPYLYQQELRDILYTSPHIDKKVGNNLSQEHIKD